MINTPIAYIIFNRPRHTRETFAVIRAQRPARLFIIADGPRTGHPTDVERCREVREIVDQIDWPCDVYRNYAEQNLGLKRRVSSGLDWVFGQVERAIVLEDDCLSHSDFFTYCESLLDRYQNDERVWVITGNNFQKGHKRGDAAYYFSKYNHCWGWASWSRAWQHYQGELPFWSEWKCSTDWLRKTPDRIERQYWSNIFDKVSRSEIDSWAYPWTACVWYHGGLTATPNINLVTNIGFGPDGTHTVASDEQKGHPIYPLGPLTHPEEVKQNLEADRYVFNHHFGGIHSRLHARIGRLAMTAASRLLPQHVKAAGRHIVSRHYRENYRIAKMLRKIEAIPRYVEGTTSIFGRQFRFVDSASFISCYKSIFIDEIYKFRADTEMPYIIDCGANIGLSALYFKKLFPSSKITAFEPDKKIFSVLKDNVETFQLKDIELVNKGIWKEDSLQRFLSEGADAGRIAQDVDRGKIVEVPMVSLRKYLDRPIDFLKVDIEGAETEVLKSCEDLLKNVKGIYVEYHSFPRKEQTLDELLAVLRRAGFRITIGNPMQTKPGHFRHATTYMSMDLQLDIIGYRG